MSLDDRSRVRRRRLVRRRTLLPASAAPHGTTWVVHALAYGLLLLVGLCIVAWPSASGRAERELESEVVYVALDCYHTADCEYADRGRPMPLGRAADTYAPCFVCEPREPTIASDGNERRVTKFVLALIGFVAIVVNVRRACRTSPTAAIRTGRYR